MKAFIGVVIIFAATFLLIFRDSILPPGGFSDSSLVVQHLPLETESVKSNTASKMITQPGGSATSGHLFKVTTNKLIQFDVTTNKLSLLKLNFFDL